MTACQKVWLEWPLKPEHMHREFEKFAAVILKICVLVLGKKKKFFTSRQPANWTGACRLLLFNAVSLAQHYLIRVRCLCTRKRILTKLPSTSSTLLFHQVPSHSVLMIWPTLRSTMGLLGYAVMYSSMKSRHDASSMSSHVRFTVNKTILIFFLKTHHSNDG